MRLFRLIFGVEAISSCGRNDDHCGSKREFFADKRDGCCSLRNRDSSGFYNNRDLDGDPSPVCNRAARRVFHHETRVSLHEDFFLAERLVCNPGARPEPLLDTRVWLLFDLLYSARSPCQH